MSFTMKSFRDVFSNFNLFRVNENTSLWFFAIVLIAAYSPLAWVRRLQVFEIGYIVGVFMIIWTVIVICGYSIDGLIEHGPQQPGTFYAVNPDTNRIWDMIGFSFYTFEGIGTVMPIIEKTQSSVNV